MSKDRASKREHSKTNSKNNRSTKKTITEARKELATARNLIRDQILADKPPKGEVDISLAYDKSTETLANYVTLDWKHISDIKTISDNIVVYSRDKKKSRPLNIILQADPGSGKSHFVKCLAKKLALYSIKEVVFNMTAMGHLDDLAMAIETVRNIKVNDELPLLFLDEFDHNPNNFALLLPLLWDGALQVGHRDLKVGKVVIVLAGSKKDISKAIESSKTIHTEILNEKEKLLDLLSRINGGELVIPGLEKEKGDRNRKVDKVCIAASLILHRFEEIEELPWILLHFISRVKFRYGVRSIYTLIDQIPTKKKMRHKLETKDLKLPLKNIGQFMNSNLVRHIIYEDEPADVVTFWKNLTSIEGSDKPVRIVRKKEKQPSSSLGLYLNVFPPERD